MSKVTFYTDNYEFVHGKKPSGVGRWAFRLIGTDNEIWINGSYASVKKLVAKQAKSAGFERVELLA